MLLAACISKPPAPRPPPKIEVAPELAPRAEPRSKYGNPPSYVVLGKRYYVMDRSDGYAEQGIASWYGRKFHGRRASSGETYDMYAMTAAHKSLPLPTYVRVTNLANQRSVVLRVNDRGPFHDNRIIDLSYAAACKLDILREGTGLVEVRALSPPTPRAVATVSEARAPTGEPQLFVQAGAFVERRNAERLRAQLSAKALRNVRIQAGKVSTQPVYRVRLGPFSSVEASDLAVEQLDAIGVQGHRVVE
ncbi:MAG: septal ring lytic transglycosylase RlpA family protein [Gammaproteobacteria bacterium]